MRSDCKYKPEFVRELLNMAEDGMSYVQIAAHFKVDKKTMYDWGHNPNLPEFSEAYKIAKTLQEAYHEGVLQKIAKGVLKGASAASQIYLMKSRFKDDWSETTTQKIELTNNVKNMTDDQIDEAIKTLMAQRAINKSSGSSGSSARP